MKRILFVCEYNACRSQMAEGLAKHLLPGHEIHSAGLYPGSLHEMTITVMKEIGIDITSQRSKLLAEVASHRFDQLVILASPAIEPSRIIFAKDRLEWSMPDPALTPGNRDTVLAAMRQARDAIRKLIERDFRP